MMDEYRIGSLDNYILNTKLYLNTVGLFAVWVIFGVSGATSKAENLSSMLDFFQIEICNLVLNFIVFIKELINEMNLRLIRASRICNSKKVYYKR